MASDTAARFDAPRHNSDDERRERARSVSADLEAIFGQPLAGAAQTRAKTVSAARAPRGEAAPGHRLSAASMGALAAAALAGLAAGSLLMKPVSPAKTAASHPAALPVEMTSGVTAPQTAEATLPEPGPLAPTRAPSYALAAPPPAPGPARSVRRVRAREACCTYAEVQAADRHLRQAYAGAIRAGAPRSVIVEARDRWAAARRRAAHDPARLVASYRAIAGDLTRASARTRAHAPRTIRARFHPRYSAWWW